MTSLFFPNMLQSPPHMDIVVANRFQQLKALARHLADAIARPGVAEEDDTQRPETVARLVLAAVSGGGGDASVAKLLAPHAEAVLRSAAVVSSTSPLVS